MSIDWKDVNEELPNEGCEVILSILVNNPEEAEKQCIREDCLDDWKKERKQILGWYYNGAFHFSEYFWEDYHFRVTPHWEKYDLIIGGDFCFVNDYTYRKITDYSIINQPKEK